MHENARILRPLTAAEAAATDGGAVGPDPQAIAWLGNAVIAYFQSLMSV